MIILTKKNSKSTDKAGCSTVRGGFGGFAPDTLINAVLAQFLGLYDWSVRLSGSAITLERNELENFVRTLLIQNKRSFQKLDPIGSTGDPLVFLSQPMRHASNQSLRNTGHVL
jgi:hypothetical protein